MRLMLQSDAGDAYACLGVARLLERRADNQLVLDQRYIPPMLRVSDNALLAGYVREVAGLLHQRGEALAAQVAQPGRGGVGEIADFLLLQAVNRYEPEFMGFTSALLLHPERLFAASLQLAGELSTFSRESRRVPTYPDYLHDDLEQSFTPLMADLRRSLWMVLDAAAVPIELQDRKYGVRVAVIADLDLHKSAGFVLAVNAQMPGEALRTRFPTQVKIGPVERIRDLVNLQLPGIPLRALPVAPRQIPFHAGFNYFELERGSELWDQLERSAGWRCTSPATSPASSSSSGASRDSHERRRSVRLARLRAHHHHADAGRARRAGSSSAARAAGRRLHPAGRRSMPAASTRWWPPPTRCWTWCRSCAPRCSIPTRRACATRWRSRSATFETRAQAAGVRAEHVIAARYVLCTLLDEAAASTPWGGSGTWASHSLLVMFHNETWGGEKFFQLLAKLAEDPAANRDLLELMYVCLALGFEGRYRVHRQRQGRSSTRARAAGADAAPAAGRYERALSPHWQGTGPARKTLLTALPLWITLGALGLLLAGAYLAFDFALNDNPTRSMRASQALGKPAVPAPAPPAPLPAAQPRLARCWRPRSPPARSKCATRPTAAS